MPPHIVRYPPIQCNTRERCDQLQIPAAPPAWRVPEGPDNLAAAPMGGGGAWPGFEATHNRASAAGVEGAGGSGGHGRASRSTTPSRRLVCGDLAGGRARRRPEHQRCHKQQNSKAWAPEGQAAEPVGGGGAWPGFEGKLHHTQRHKRRRCGGRRRAGGPGRASRSTTPSRRLACGDLAGGRTRRRPEHQRRHTQREPDTRKPRPADAGRGQPTQSGGKV